jgi:hypothetical protein
MPMLYKALFLTLPLASAGCSSAATCEQTLTQSETSNGTYVYVASDGSAAVHGDLGSSTGLTVTSDTAYYSDPTSVLVSGNFTDDTGTLQSFYLVVAGVTAGAKVSIGADSQACLEDLSACTPLSGTVETSAFSTDCRGQDGCALTIEGALNVSTRSDGTDFAINVALGHHDEWATEACE